MRLEWAILCNEIEPSEDGLSVQGIGQNGRLVDDLPLPVLIPVLLCFLVDENDPAGTTCRFEQLVIGPRGKAVDYGEAAVEWNPGSSPKLASPERLYRPLPVKFTVVETGLHTIAITSAQEIVELPLLFCQLPSN